MPKFHGFSIRYASLLVLIVYPFVFPSWFSLIYLFLLFLLLGCEIQTPPDLFPREHIWFQNKAHAFLLILSLAAFSFKLVFLVMQTQGSGYFFDPGPSFEYFLDAGMRAEDAVKTLLPSFLMTVTMAIVWVCMRKALKRGNLAFDEPEDGKKDLGLMQAFCLVLLSMTLCVLPLTSFSLVGLLFACFAMIFLARRFLASSPSFTDTFLEFLIKAITVAVFCLNYLFLIPGIRENLIDEDFLGFYAFKNEGYSLKRLFYTFLLLASFCLLCYLERLRSLAKKSSTSLPPTVQETIRPIIQETWEIEVPEPRPKLSEIHRWIPLRTFDQTQKLALMAWQTLSRAEFVLNFLEFYTIFIIMRHKTIYSIPLILGVFAPPFLPNHKKLTPVLTVLFVPAVVLETLSLFLFNLDSRSFEIDAFYKGIFGFRPVNLALEYALLIGYFILTLFYIGLRNQKAKKPGKSLENPKLTVLSILNMLIIEYTDVVVMFILFWIGMYTVNLIHCGLVSFFFVYMLMKVNYLPSDYDLDTNLSRAPAKRGFHELTVIYWKFLLVYLELIILLKYIWAALVQDFISFDNTQKQILHIVGLSYDYSFGLDISTEQEDIGQNMIFWMLFFFVFLQFKMLRFKLQTSKGINNLKRKLLNGRTFCSKLTIFTFKWAHIIYFKSILMVSYFVIMMILVFVGFNLINSLVLLCFLLILTVHFFRLIPSKTVKIAEIGIKMHKYWTFFLFLVSLILIARYLYQFLSFNLIYEQISDKISSDGFYSEMEVLGLIIHENICYEIEKNGRLCLSNSSKLREGFLPDVLLVFFTLLSKNYLRMVFIYHGKLQYVSLSPLKGVRTSKRTGSSILNLKKRGQGIRSRSFESITSEEDRARGRSPSAVSPSSEDDEKLQRLRSRQIRKEYLKEMKEIFNEYIDYPLSSINWLEKLCRFSSGLFFHLNFILILVFSGFFKISLAMWIFILIYLWNYNGLLKIMIQATGQLDILRKIQRKIGGFEHFFIRPEAFQRVSSQNQDFANDPETIYNFFESVLAQLEFNYLTRENTVKEKIWKSTIIFSVLFLLMTYVSQFLGLPSSKEDQNLKNLSWFLELFGTFKKSETSLLRNIYPYILLIWLTYFEIIVSKIWKKERLTQKLETLHTLTKAQAVKDDGHFQDEQILSGQISGKTEAFNRNDTKFEEIIDVIPEDASHDFDHRNQVRLMEPNNHSSKPPSECEQMGEGDPHEKLSSKASSVPLRIPKEEDMIEKKRRWYKIVNFYNHYNLFIKLNWILHLEVYFELSSLAILLICYNMLSTVSSLVYLLVIAAICLYKNKSKILSIKNFCILMFNVKYLCFLLFFHLENSNENNNLMTFVISNQDLPSSYFSIGISDQEFLAFLLLFLNLFLIEVYAILNIKIIRYISKHLHASIASYLGEFDAVQKRMDYEQWEAKSNRFFIDLQAAFFCYFDRVVILSVGFFSISEYFFFNLVNFVSSIIYLFLVDFQTQWELFTNLVFKARFCRILLYFSFIALAFDHIFLIPQISEGCQHFLCKEATGSKYDKLYNVFILQTFLTLMRLKFYGDFPEFSKMQAFRAELLAKCKTFHYNDKKVHTLLKEIEIKKILRERINIVTYKLERWHEKFFSEGKPIVAKTQAKKPPVANKPEAKKKTKKPLRSSLLRSNFTTANARSFIKKAKTFIFAFLSQNRDIFLFSPTLSLLEFVLQKNNRQIKTSRISAVDYVLGRCENLHKLSNYLERLQSEICKAYRRDGHPSKNIEGVALSMKVEMKHNLRFIDVLPEDCDDNPLLSGAITRKLLILSFEDGEMGFDEIRMPGIGKISEANVSVLAIGRRLLEVMISHWEWVCVIMLIFYHFYSQAICSFFIIFYTFAILCIEEHHSTAKTWKPLFIYIFTLAVIKMVMFLPMIKPFSEDDLRSKTFAYSNDYIPIYKLMLGHDISISYEFWLLIFIAFQVQKLKLMGLAQSPINKIENVYEGFLRKKINHDLVLKSSKTAQKLKNEIDEDSDSDLDDEKNLSNQMNASELEDSEIPALKTILRKPTVTAQAKPRPAFKTIGFKIMMGNRNLRQFDELTKRVIQDLEKKLMSEYFTMKERVFESAFRRVFSQYSKKPGKDYYRVLMSVQACILIYIFFFYSKMKASIVYENEMDFSNVIFSGDMVLFIFINLGIVLFERVLVLYNSKAEKKARPSVNEEKDSAGTTQGAKETSFAEEVEKQAKEALPRGRISEGGFLSFNTLQLSPIKAAESRKNFSPSKGVGLSGSKELQPEKSIMVSSKKKQRKDKKKNAERIFLSGIFIKYVFHVVLLVLFCYFTLILMPTGTSNDFPRRCTQSDGQIDCVLSITNSYLLGFYFLYSLYFLFSSLQIRNGMKSLKLKNTFLSHHQGKLAKYLFYAYRNVPFLFELKNFLDWTITTTSLTLFQWIKLEEIHAHLFICKASSQKFKQRKHGKSVSLVKKVFLGGFSVIFILALLFGPMIFFSDLNPATDSNLVLGAGFEIGLWINSENYFKLYSSSLIKRIEKVNDTTFASLFQDVGYFQTIDKSMFQMVSMQENSESYWDITEPNYQIILSSLNSTFSEGTPSTLSFEMMYYFRREKPIKHSDGVYNQGRISYPLQNTTILRIMFQQMTNTSAEALDLPNFYYTTVKLVGKDDPILLTYDEKFYQGITMKLWMNPNQTIDRYWSIRGMQGNSSFTFYTVCDKYISQLFGFSMWGFYISIIYLIGKLLRMSVSGSLQNFLLNDLPNPDNILKICEAIIVYRSEKDLFHEQLLYYELIDLLKSPEVFKSITGSNVETIKQKKSYRRMLRERQQEEEEMKEGLP